MFVEELVDNIQWWLFGCQREDPDIFGGSTDDEKVRGVTFAIFQEFLTFGIFALAGCFGIVDEAKIHVKCSSREESFTFGLLASLLFTNFGFVAKWAGKVSCVGGERRHTVNNFAGFNHGSWGDVSHSLMPEFKIFIPLCGMDSRGRNLV